MKLATMMVALVAAVASLAAGGNAFVMPPAGVAGRNAGQQALAPATSQPAPSRSSGKGETREGRRTGEPRVQSLLSWWNWGGALLLPLPLLRCLLFEGVVLADAKFLL